MPKTFAIGDIHGGLKALIQVLDRANIKPQDTLIFLGDYVDGWSESPQVLDFLIALAQTHNCIFMRGNHDDLLLQWLETSRDNKQWYNFGGLATVIAYQSVNAATKQKHINFLKNLQDYHLDENARLFLHAGFTNQRGVTHEFFTKMFYWDRTLWETALAMDPKLPETSDYYPKRFRQYTEIFIGHTPTTYIGESNPQKRANIWNIDTGAGFEGKLSILDVDTKAFWQSDPLYLLYHNENGRNQ